MNTNSAAGDEPETIYTNPSGSGAKRTPAMTLCESIRHKLGDAEFVPGEEWRFEISSREGPGTAVVRLVVEKNARAAVERTPEKRAYTGYRGYTPCLGLVEAAPLSRLLWEFYAPGFRLSAGTDKYETDEEFHEAFYRSFMERESKLGDCLTVTEVATALDGQPLPPDRQAHVDGCPKCTTELKELKASCPKDDPRLKEEEECEYELDDGGGRGGGEARRDARSDSGAASGSGSSSRGADRSRAPAAAGGARGAGGGEDVCPSADNAPAGAGGDTAYNGDSGVFTAGSHGAAAAESRDPGADTRDAAASGHQAHSSAAGESAE